MPSAHIERDTTASCLNKHNLIDLSPLYPESNSVPPLGDGGKAEAAQMRGKPPGL